MTQKIDEKNTICVIPILLLHDHRRAIFQYIFMSEEAMQTSLFAKRTSANLLAAACAIMHTAGKYILL